MTEFRDFKGHFIPSTDGGAHITCACGRRLWIYPMRGNEPRAECSCGREYAVEFGSPPHVSIREEEPREGL